MSSSEQPPEDSDNKRTPISAPAEFDTHNQDAQAYLVAQLLELTTRISAQPLSKRDIDGLNHVLDEFKRNAQPEMEDLNDGAGPEQHRSPEHDSVPRRRRADSTPTESRQASAIANSQSSAGWSKSPSESVVTGPTAAETRTTRPDQAPQRQGQPGTVETSGAAAGEEVASGPWLDAFSSRSAESDSREVLDSVRSISSDLTRLVHQLHLRHEEARHVHEMGLAKYLGAMKELARARKDIARLQQDNKKATARVTVVESALQQLTEDMNDIQDEVIELVAECRVRDAVTRDVVEREAQSITQRIETWRNDCLNVATKVRSRLDK